jgi:hypothetical protein
MANGYARCLACMGGNHKHCTVTNNSGKCSCYDENPGIHER